MGALKWLALVIFPCLLNAQVPFKFNYQGVARDAQGNALGNQEISLLISVIRGSQDGIIEFSEQHFVTTSDNGLFALKIGDGTFITGNLRNIDWSLDDYYIRTEMDAAGGENYLELGTSQLYSVPYALFALKSANTGGGSGSGADEQTLSLDGTILSIENGNSVNLAPLKDGVEDADADPTNEIQTLSLNGSTLSITRGNSVSLPAGNGGSGDSPWQVLSDGAINYNGEVLITEDLDNPAIGLYKNEAGTGWSVYQNREEGTLARSTSVDGEFGVFGLNNNADISFQLGTRSVDGNGFLDLNNGAQNGVALGVFNSTGRITSYGPNGNRNASLTNLNGSENNGFLAAFDDVGDTKAAVLVNENAAGLIYTNGPNGNRNISLNNLGANDNHGYLSVNDADGANQAGLYVDNAGQGIIFADVKNFRTPHPVMADHDIVYASLEGPEAAAYLRGTAAIEHGSGEVNFPEHFQHIISANSMTVMLTPLSANSKGLAVTYKGGQGFRVQELDNGEGDYSFDWEVKAVRSGFENYEVIRKNAATLALPAANYTSPEVYGDTESPVTRKAPIRRQN